MDNAAGGRSAVLDRHVAFTTRAELWSIDSTPWSLSSRIRPDRFPASPRAVAGAYQQQLAEQLLAQAKEQEVELVGPNELLNQLTKKVLELSSARSCEAP